MKLSVNISKMGKYKASVYKYNLDEISSVSQNMFSNTFIIFI